MTKRSLFFICLFVGCFGGITGFTVSAQTMKVPKLHRAASDFTLKTPGEEDLSLSSLKGQYVIVDFWASWCMPCRAEIPHLKELYVQYHAAGLEIVSISIDAHPEAWKRAMGQEQMPWKQLMDTYSGRS